ncbi:MAG: alpha/beta fold hydrolase [Myxococcota bacterium]
MSASVATVAPGPSPIHLVRHGTGSHLFVGIHGWSGSRNSFDPLLAHLPADASLITFDLPGFGAKDAECASAVGRAHEPFVEPVHLALSTLEAETFTLVGSCGGAVVALELLLEKKLPVERVVLIDPFAYAPWYFRIFALPLLGPLLYAMVFMNPLGRHLTNQGLVRHREGDTDLVEGFRETRHDANLRYLRWMIGRGEESLHRYGCFEGRVDIIFGRRTFGAVRRSVEMWRKVWPGLVAFEIAGAGHIPVFEAPEAVADIVFRRREHHAL